MEQWAVKGVAGLLLPTYLSVRIAVRVVRPVLPNLRTPERPSLRSPWQRAIGVLPAGLPRPVFTSMAMYSARAAGLSWSHAVKDSVDAPVQLPQTKKECLALLREHGYTGYSVDAIDGDRVYVLSRAYWHRDNESQPGVWRKDAHTVVFFIGPDGKLTSSLFEGWVA